MREYFCYTKRQSRLKRDVFEGSSINSTIVFEVEKILVPIYKFTQCQAKFDHLKMFYKILK